MTKGNSYLCADTPVEPAYIGRVSEECVDTTGDQDVALGLLILDDVVEVGACCEHGHLPQAFAQHNHKQSQYAEPAQLFNICNGIMKY